MTNRYDEDSIREMIEKREERRNQQSKNTFSQPKRNGGYIVLGIIFLIISFLPITISYIDSLDYGYFDKGTIIPFVIFFVLSMIMFICYPNSKNNEYLVTELPKTDLTYRREQKIKQRIDEQSKNYGTLSYYEIQTVLNKYQKQIPVEYVPILMKELEYMPSYYMSGIMDIPIKRKGITLLLSCLWGLLGLDRFYLRDNGLGASKLFFRIISLIFTNIPTYTEFGNSLTGILAIWCIIDIFLTYSKTKKINKERIEKFIYRTKSKCNYYQTKE